MAFTVLHDVDKYCIKTAGQNACVLVFRVVHYRPIKTVHTYAQMSINNYK